MSTASDPSATTTTNGNGNNASQKTPSLMLDKYLATPPSITENLAFPGPPRAAKRIAEERRKKAAEYIEGWQTEWERMG
ncbi:hypothetical protein VE01_00477 [Pseudogymnoascus verrucosus]|uniref:Uncharacterized protein n=1 Tax=Pseudogymnoascus verrucosus TaxID=342668 RepID=A0A2P2SYB2_9PEZI|nr:uncharacterized protein VE01_00477 [Pseudogymnoascus verrucosus]OBU01785.1 hypothetical protein VE01_00477 [Pseudogymnoascus verrucosus]